MLAQTEALCEVTLTSLAHGGEAVGRLPDGRVVFVAGGAPGDVALVQVEERRKDYARGRLLRVLQAGPARVEPPCPLASAACGGCPFMHVSREAQLAAKEDFVRRALRGLPGLEVRPILAPAPALGYRLRARLVQRRGLLGYSGQRSHEVVQARACPVLEPALEGALLGSGGVVAALSGLLGEEGTLAALAGGDKIHVAVVLGTGADRTAVRGALRRLLAAGVIVGASLAGKDSEERLGAAAVDVGDAERPLWIPAGGFAQACPAGHGMVPQLVAEAVEQPGSRWPRLLELHAGSGNLTRWLRPLCDELVVAEADPAALGRLRKLLGDSESLQAHAEPAARLLSRLAHGGARFPVVVMDPPRGGAVEEVQLLPRLEPQRVVYLSCEPMTLARDLRTLQGAGYQASWVQPIDLMPQTAQVEVLALAERA